MKSQACRIGWRMQEIRTVQSDDGEDEDQRQHQDNNRVDLQTGRLIGVQPCFEKNCQLEHAALLLLHPIIVHPKPSLYGAIRISAMDATGFEMRSIS